MLRHARLRLLVAGPAGVALGTGLMHGVHAVALMGLPALLPLCGGGAESGPGAALLATVLRALAAPGTQGAVLLASIAFVAALTRRRRCADRHIKTA
jgi:hypothetical protein